MTAPRGLTIEHAHPVEGWTGTVEGDTATWSGGSLSSAVVATFGVTLKANAKPGLIELRTEQRYADHGVVEWPVVLTITPAVESPSQNLALEGIVGLIGVLVVAAIALLAWRGRPPPA